MKEVRLFTAGPDFAEDAAVLALLREAFASMQGRIDPPSSLHRLDPEGLAAKRRAERLILARDADGIVGCIFLAHQSDHAYASKLAVAPARQRQGIARALLAEAEGQADRPVLRLQSRVELVENHALFLRCGFREVARTAHAGYDRPTSITFEKTVRAIPD
ncbi:GNAT family N-acetyltransferase [Pontivivens ytuae]|uniref:GNAT family N-acetyltransferase n=1 Tax=Pontivivens ytuae TaxID=2789856 RepID=A0A7S9LPA4_9RHOB|nr:GNAT family N-acetyltransferase [Pontivivens ytuae]QPH52662.1 GNAT family N-acetyltransferase [Pontivivens ytuae]